MQLIEFLSITITFMHHLRQPCFPELLQLQQLISRQLNWSVKSCQLCGTERRWWTKQLSVGMTRMGNPFTVYFFLIKYIKLCKTHLEKRKLVCTRINICLYLIFVHPGNKVPCPGQLQI